MTGRRVQIIVAALFLIVAVLAVVNTWRLNEYIRTTVERDDRLQACNTETLGVLTDWLQARRTRDGSMGSRDDALIVVIDRLIDGQHPSDAEFRAWRDAVAADRQVRIDMAGLFQKHPLPHC